METVVELTNCITKDDGGERVFGEPGGYWKLLKEVPRFKERIII